MGFNKIDNGEIITAKELILDVCTDYGVKVINGNIQYKEVDNYFKQGLDEATKEYLEFQSKPDEEHLKYIEETFDKMIKKRDKMIIHYTNIKEKYSDMIKQFNIWKCPEFWTKMSNNIKDGLTKEYQFAEEILNEYQNKKCEKESLEDFKTRMTKYHLNRIKNCSEDYFAYIEEIEESNKTIKELIESLDKLDEKLENSNENSELNIPKMPSNTSFSPHDCATFGNCSNCGRTVNSYNRKCECGQELKW